MNIILLLGAVLGLSAVGMGAYTDHGLSATLDAKTLAMMKTALHYQLIHSVLVVCIGLILFTSIPLSVSKRLKLAGWVFIIGILLFSFSIYFAAISGIMQFTHITPAGGMLLMLGWVALGSAGIHKDR